MIIIKTLVGSRAYGTYLPGSDYDYVSVAVPPIGDILGLGYRETVFTATEEEDNTTHSFQKFMLLASNSNPNVLDVLFSPPTLWVARSEFWDQIYFRRNIFLSQKVVGSYFGYASAQLKRMKTHRGWLLKPPQEKPKRADFGLPDHPTVPREHREAVVSIPLKFLAEGVQETAKREKEYERAKKGWQQYEKWKKERNPERAALEAKFGYDTKHAMHLFRLLKQALELLQTGVLNVVRTGIDAELLKEIRFYGIYTYDQLMDEVDKLKSEIEIAKANTSLPSEPDMAAINQLCVDTLRTYIMQHP